MSAYFSIERVAKVTSLPPGASVHIIGVCGVAMAPLAVALTAAGYAVTGSDREYYEPMISLLRRYPIALRTGYAACNIPDSAACVVIGNSARRENEEVLETERRGLPFTFFPACLYDLVIEGRRSVVVTGTHGKSTTTALVASALHTLGVDCSFFFGAQSLQFPVNTYRGQANLAVVEGDEYDSAFFAKMPKFHFYRPDVLVITSLEFDHADVFPSLQAIEDEFVKLIASMSREATVIACADYPAVRRVLRAAGHLQVITYGQFEADFTVEDLSSPDGAAVRVAGSSEVCSLTPTLIRLPVPGFYNGLNGVAASLALTICGLPSLPVVAALERYQGLKRRQEVRYQSGNVTIIEDFAHHPTAVRETLAGLKQRYPRARLVAVFEPRSNTSRRRIFEREYGSALAVADLVYIAPVPLRPGDEVVDDRLDVAKVVGMVRSEGSEAFGPIASAELVRLIEAQVRQSPGPIVCAILSNGSFDGLLDALLALLPQQRA